MTTSPWPTLCALMVIDLPKDTIGFGMAAEAQRLDAPPTPNNPKEDRCP